MPACLPQQPPAATAASLPGLNVPGYQLWHNNECRPCGFLSCNVVELQTIATEASCVTESMSVLLSLP